MRAFFGEPLRRTLLYLWRILVVGLVNALVLTMLLCAPL